MNDLLRAPDHPRRSPLRAWMVLGGVLTLILGCVAYFVVIPNVRPAGFDPYPTIGMIPLLSLLAGFGFALPFACLWANRGQMRAMLRFTWGRFLSTLGIVGLFPYGLFGIFPMAFGLIAVSVPLQLLFNESGPMTATHLSMIPVIFAANGLGYALTCAILFGLRKRWRFAAFLFTYAGSISFLLLMGLGSAPRL